MQASKTALVSKTAYETAAQPIYFELPQSGLEPAAGLAPDASAGSLSNITRSVYCVLGMPIDAIDLTAVVYKIQKAAARRVTFLISTPNLNFLVNSLSDPEFRESLLSSDLCPPDGIPIVWIARIFGLPIRTRVAGSDILEQIRVLDSRARRLNIFLFGGAKGVSTAAAKTINAELGGLRCVGTIDPGFCDVTEMSQNHTIEAVNSSNADFLAVSLGAKKGQLWLHRNHERLTIPIRVHLGAAINFLAGTVKRAPPSVRAWHLEWAWRITQEPHLAKRYWYDGRVLLRLLFTRILPLAMATRWYQLRRKHQTQDLNIEARQGQKTVTIGLRGAAIERNIEKAVSLFSNCLLLRSKIIVVDLSDTQFIDSRFFGLLMMVNKELQRLGGVLRFTGVSSYIRMLFRFNEIETLLASDDR